MLLSTKFNAIEKRRGENILTKARLFHLKNEMKT